VITCAGLTVATQVRPLNWKALVRAPCSAFCSSAASLGVEPAVTAGLDAACSRPQDPPAPDAEDELAVVEAAVEVAAAAALVELLVDELDDVELPQAAAPAARARLERMVAGRRTLASLACPSDGRRVAPDPPQRAEGRAHLYCRACLHTTF
jgi:hypothetical protein